MRPGRKPNPRRPRKPSPQFPGGDLREATVDLVARRWLQRDPAAAADWIRNLPERERIRLSREKIKITASPLRAAHPDPKFSAVSPPQNKTHASMSMKTPKLFPRSMTAIAAAVLIQVLSARTSRGRDHQRCVRQGHVRKSHLRPGRRRLQIRHQVVLVRREVQRRRHLCRESLRPAKTATPASMPSPAIPRPTSSIGRSKETS